jgi:hypothetical protein
VSRLNDVGRRKEFKVSNAHKVQVGLKKPKEYKRNNDRKNYQREKTELYVSRLNDVGRREEFKVSKRNSTWINRHET